MDNVLFEIMNEPYTRKVPLEWQQHIADVIVETERTLPKKHLISQNIANKSGIVAAAHPAVSVFNFHYASSDSVSANYALNKVIGDNETGFKGTSDTPYRQEAWEFLLAGGGLFNHLDYSFAAGFEDGTFSYPSTQPGGGSTAFRRQMKVLRDFIDGFDFIHMHPDDSAVQAPSGLTVHALVSDHAMAAFAKGAGSATTLTVQLPAGTWTGGWIDTVTGATTKTIELVGGGPRAIDAPAYTSDIALRLTRNP
jgi:hypothetical protein